MATLIWDKVGERTFQGGIDRGVLYLQEGKAVVWNGLKSIEDASSSELKLFYLDGVKYLQTLLPRDFISKLKAITYPDEFETVSGASAIREGLNVGEQPAKSFNLSYRSRIGTNIDGVEHGYRIHILYNIVANPEAHAFDTFSDAIAQPVEFVWNLTGTPEKLYRMRPTVHVVIDSTKTNSEVLRMLEEKLYGTEISDASLPSLQEIADYFGYLGGLVIVDHGDGTWSAIDEGNDYISMLDSTTFQIANANAEFIISGRTAYSLDLYGSDLYGISNELVLAYTISSTNVG